MLQTRAPVVSTSGYSPGELGHGPRAGDGLLVRGERVEAQGVVQGAPQLDAPGCGLEAGVAVGAQQALLVHAVVERRVAGCQLLYLLEGVPRLLQDVGEQVLHGFPRPGFRRDALADVEGYLHVGPRLAQGLYRLVDGLGALRPIADAQAVALRVRAGGQEVVGQRHGRRRHEQVDDNDGVDVHMRGEGALRVDARAGQRVGGLHPGDLDGIGLARFQAPDVVVGHAFLEAHFDERVRLLADALRLLLRRRNSEPSGGIVRCSQAAASCRACRCCR